MKTYLTNAQNEKLAVEVIKSANSQAPVVILEHGLAGFKEEGMIKAAANVFMTHHFTVVTFDARFNLGESSGPLEQANFTHFIEDLAFVVNWVKSQAFYGGNLILAGHSLGAGACLDYAAKHPDEVMGLVSMAAVVSGKLLLESYLKHKPDFVSEWQKNKLLYRAHPFIKERQGYISYAHIEDALRYHLIDEMDKILCPVLLICAERDISSTLKINRFVFDALKGPKKLVVIQNSGHTFKTEGNQDDLSKAIDTWIDDNHL